MKKYILIKPYKLFGDTNPKGTMLMLDNITAKSLLKKGIVEEFGVAIKKEIVSPKTEK